MSLKKTSGTVQTGVKPKLAIATAGKKIDSPHAKYTHGGLLLSCSLCNTPVKSELFWTAHVNGRQHRDNLSKLQKGKEVDNVSSSALSFGSKRKGDIDDGPPVKKKDGGFPADFFDKPVDGFSKPKPAAPAKPKSILKNKEAVVEEKKVVTAVLSMATGSSEVTIAPGGAFKDIEKPSKMADTSLPEGFFDDPKLDAKARNVEYKDPQAEEWERFQREMKELETVSETIIEEDSEISTADRQLEEIDEQLHRWNRVLEIEKKKEELVPVPKSSEDDDMSSGEDSDDLDALLDWRSKGTKLNR